MTKVMLNGEEIELVDELEPGYLELDKLTDEDLGIDEQVDTIEIRPINLDDTQKLEFPDLSSTQEIPVGDNNE